MADKTLVESSFSATINAPIEKIDILSWCFTLPESEHQACSPAHCSAGATTTPDGPRMSITVEILGWESNGAATTSRRLASPAAATRFYLGRVHAYRPNKNRRDLGFERQED